MKRAVRKLVGLVIVVVIGLALGFAKAQYGHATAPVIQVGGMEITVGETTVKEMADAGFTFSGDGYVSELEASTWMNMIFAEKTGADVSITVYNDSSETKSIEECTVGEVDVFESQIPSCDSIVINDVEVKDLNYEGAKEKFKDEKDANYYETYMHLNYGDNQVELDFGDNDTLNEILVKFEFGKSYE